MIEYWPCGTISGEGHQELCVSQEFHLFFKTNARSRLETGTSISRTGEKQAHHQSECRHYEGRAFSYSLLDPRTQNRVSYGRVSRSIIGGYGNGFSQAERWNDLHMGTQPVNKWSHLLGSKLVASPWVSCLVAHGNNRMSENHTLPLHLSPRIPPSLAPAEAEVCLAWAEHGHPGHIPVGACSKQAFHGYGGGGGHGLARWAGLHPCHLLSSLLTTHSHWLLKWALQRSLFKKIYDWTFT